MDSNSSSATEVVPLLFPESVIPSTFSHQTIVSDVPIPRGTMFGPYPGNDAVEKKCNNWMQYVTSVTDCWESNLLVAFLKNQLYFYCSRHIRAGTELIVWGGQKKIHLRDPSEWTTYKMNETGLTFLCQECDLNLKTAKMLARHNSSIHQGPKMLEKNCKCPHCPFVGYRMDLRKHLVKHGIDLYGNPLVINQNKSTIESEHSESDSKSQPDSGFQYESDSEFKSRSESDSEFESQSGFDLESDSDSEKTSTAKNEEIAKKCEYNCKLCKKTFDRLPQLYGHIGTMHKLNKAAYGEITSNRKLDSNEDSNVNKGPCKEKRMDYTCNYCKNVYFTSQARRRHVKCVHLGIRFACSVCRNEYTTKYTLNKHIKKSHNLKASAVIVQNGKSCTN